MRTATIAEGTNTKGQKFRVKAVYHPGDQLLYTRTYIFDSEGCVETDIKVWPDGTIHKDGEEVKV